jgi:hypothetical protein
VRGRHDLVAQDPGENDTHGRFGTDVRGLDAQKPARVVEAQAPGVSRPWRGRRSSAAALLQCPTYERVGFLRRQKVRRRDVDGADASPRLVRVAAEVIGDRVVLPGHVADGEGVLQEERLEAVERLRLHCRHAYEWLMVRVEVKMAALQMLLEVLDREDRRLLLQEERRVILLVRLELA